MCVSVPLEKKVQKVTNGFEQLAKIQESRGQKVRKNVCCSDVFQPEFYSVIENTCTCARSTRKHPTRMIQRTSKCI